MQYSLEEVKNLSPKLLLKIINEGKNKLKENDVFIEMCKEYDVSPDIIDFIPMRFGDIPVSARTEKGIITFNYKLLCNGDFDKELHYMIHECRHYMDQCYGEKPTMGANDGNYLDNPFEQDAFKTQVQYLDDMYGEDEAEDYVDHLLDHHNEKGKDKEEKKEILMEKV